MARLARLGLTEEELERFTTQLAAVLEHAADIAALDISEVPPTAHPFPLANVFREDVPRPCLPRDEVLSQAPGRRGQPLPDPADFGGGPMNATGPAGAPSSIELASGVRQGRRFGYGRTRGPLGPNS